MAWQSKIDVLAVDDEARNLNALEVALGDLGPRLVKARSGEAALRELLERDFAVILMDVRMPGMDGFETARLIRARPRTRHVPIIFMTAYDRDEAGMQRAYALGAVDYLFKPIVPEILQAKVKVFVDLSERTAEVARQAELLRDMERREAERTLQAERRQWEAVALRREMDEQRRINQQLEEADRRKDEFIAILAHELRNPLVPLVSGLDVMRLRVSQDPILCRAHEAMQRQVTHLKRLVDDLVEVSRVDHGKVRLQRERVALREVLSEAISSASSLLDAANHRLDLKPPSEPVFLHADPVRLTQVVTNLLSNAARYTNDGGRVTLSWRQDGDEAEVVVADNGRGMSQDTLDDIFGLFVQSPSSERGLGLGLTLVKRLVELHGGTVTATSAGPGLGSEFTVRLPIEPTLSPELDGPDASSNGDGAERPRRLRVALVEDDEDVRCMIRMLLESWDHTIFEASNGVEGVALIKKRRPDVAFVDILMPDLDGLGVARRVRAECRRPPYLVAMSGFGQRKDIDAATEAGFDTHLVKPADAESLRAALQESVRSRGRRTQGSGDEAPTA